MRINFDPSAHHQRKVRLIISVKVFSLDNPNNDLGTFENHIYVEEPIKYWINRIGPRYNEFDYYCEYLTAYCKKVNNVLQAS